MRINYNVSAMISNNALHKNEDALSRSLERLSSGLKINHGKDNPAGLAMAKRMNAQLEGLSVASQNAANGISIIETADGAMSEMHNILQRINELTIKAKNGIMSDGDRSIVNEEVQALKEELTRISEATQFNGQNLLNGEFDLKGYTSDENVKVKDYADGVAATVYKIEQLQITKDADGKITEAKLVSVQNGTPDANNTEKGHINIKEEDGFEISEIKDSYITIKGGDGFKLQLDFPEDAEGTTTYNDLAVDLTCIGDMRLQIGANEGQVLEIRIPEVSLKNMGIAEIDVSTEPGAQDALERMDDAIKYVSSVRSRLGAYQNRLESTVGSLDITSENMTASYSRIMDVDMAEEMTEYTKNQVLTQAGTSMLAQSNERPSQVLQLLQ